MSVPAFVILSSSVGPFNSLSLSLQSTLKEIPGASEVPVIHAWNKIDSAAQPERVRAAALDRWPNTVCISAATGEGIEELLSAIESCIVSSDNMVQINLVLPYVHFLLSLFLSHILYEEVKKTRRLSIDATK